MARVDIRGLFLLNRTKVFRERRNFCADRWNPPLQLAQFLRGVEFLRNEIFLLRVYRAAHAERARKRTNGKEFWTWQSHLTRERAGVFELR